MTQSELKQLIKECLNEIDFAPGFRPTHDLTIVSTVTGSEVDHIQTYVLELQRVLKLSFKHDIQFEKKLKTSILRNEDKQVEITFTIIDIIDDLMSKTVRENIQDIYERLTDWSINEDLVIDFTFKIKR
jgi:hypothetical protein